MKINNEIVKVLEEFGINKDDGICYLISLFHGYSPTYIPDDIKRKVNMSGIVKLESKGNLQWTLPLYEGVNTAFDWVKEEYCSMFKKVNPKRGGHVREATSRLRKMFAENPEIRKEDVIGASLMYLKATNPDYIMMPHYFILKGIGAEKTYNLLDWIEKYKVSQENDLSTRTSLSNTMQ